MLTKEEYKTLLKLKAESSDYSLKLEEEVMNSIDDYSNKETDKTYFKYLFYRYKVDHERKKGQRDSIMSKKKHNYTTIDDKFDKDFIRDIESKGFRKRTSDEAMYNVFPACGYLRNVYVNEKGLIAGYCALKSFEGHRGKFKYCIRFKDYNINEDCLIQIKKWNYKGLKQNDYKTLLIKP